MLIGVCSGGDYRGTEKRLIELARKNNEIVKKDHKVGIDEKPAESSESSQL
jgi:hypothetical protein